MTGGAAMRTRVEAPAPPPAAALTLHLERGGRRLAAEHVAQLARIIAGVDVPNLLDDEAIDAVDSLKVGGIRRLFFRSH